MKDLINITKTKVRFSEVDSLHVVWHGHYIKYFEDGREAFGAQYNLGYLDIFRAGYKLPIVSVQCDYKKTVTYGETISIHTQFVCVEAAKVCFRYKIFNQKNELAAVGESVQVFLDSDNKLVLIKPKYYIDWEDKWLK